MLSRYTDRETAGAVYGIDNSVVAGSKAVAPIFGASVAILLGMRGTFVAGALVFAMIALAAWRLLPSDALAIVNRTATASVRRVGVAS